MTIETITLPEVHFKRLRRLSDAETTSRSIALLSPEAEQKMERQKTFTNNMTVYSVVERCSIVACQRLAEVRE